MKIKQSVCYPMMRSSIHISLEDFVRTIAAIGFAGLEIWTRDETFADILCLARNHHLVVTAMIGHEFGRGLNDPNNHPIVVKEIKESIDIAAEYGIPGLICLSGNRRQGIGEEEVIQATVEGLRLAAPYAEANGITLNLELLNSKIDHPGYNCDHTSWGLEVVRRVNSPCVKLLYDIYHMQIMEGDIIRTIQENIQWIGHFHTAGVPGRRDLDDSQELNYRAICRAIAETGYTGYICHEYLPKADAIESLRQTYQICNV